MTTTMLIILIVVVMIFGFWMIQYSQFRNEERKRQWELKRESQKTISPIRLRAYERLALLLERTKPEHMLMELRAKEPDAMTTWSIGQMQQYMLQQQKCCLGIAKILIYLIKAGYSYIFCNRHTNTKAI